ncbi:MAG: FHA domain-containing protein [Deltaproteobacteria bacterium]|nr:FHA domain-containing protein [Deltaproteobacteria bacterium]
MVVCVLCKAPAALGVLCTKHGVAIASRGLTSEQIVARVTRPTASLIDAWGFANPVASETAIGRDPASGLAILHASVSAEHAVIRQGEGGWELVDRGSRNGTTVNGVAAPSAKLAPGAAVSFGDVRFYFWAPALGTGPRPTGRGRTAPTRTVARVFSATIKTREGGAIEVAQRTDGGFARAGEKVVELARMELALIQTLVERLRTVTEAELAYVAWHEIAEALAFDSVEADSENVRDLVRRVRKKTATLGVGELIESKHGVGYRVAGLA